MEEIFQKNLMVYLFVEHFLVGNSNSSLSNSFTISGWGLYPISVARHIM